MTNFHVIQQDDAFAVTLADQSEWEARVIGTAPKKDLAVLEIAARSRPASDVTVTPSVVHQTARRDVRISLVQD